MLCGSLPDGLPTDIYGSLVTYAAEAAVPVILDAGGEELRHAISHRPDLVVAETDSAGAGLGAALIELGAGAAAVATGHVVRVVTATGQWSARIATATADADAPSAAAQAPARGALVAGLVPGQLLGWSWPDRLRHALALAGSASSDASGPAGPDALDRWGHVWPATNGCSTRCRSIPRSSRYFGESHTHNSGCAMVWTRLTTQPAKPRYRPT